MNWQATASSHCMLSWLMRSAQHAAAYLYCWPQALLLRLALPCMHRAGHPLPTCLYAGQKAHSSKVLHLQLICKRATIKIPPNVYKGGVGDSELRQRLEALLEKHGLSGSAGEREISRAKAKLQTERDLEGVDLLMLPSVGRAWVQVLHIVLYGYVRLLVTWPTGHREAQRNEMLQHGTEHGMKCDSEKVYSKQQDPRLQPVLCVIKIADRHC